MKYYLKEKMIYFDNAEQFITETIKIDEIIELISKFKNL